MSDLINSIGSQLIGFTLGVPAGIIASFARIYLLKLIKPNVIISNLALLGDDNKIRIKLINNSNRQVIDLSASIDIFERNSNSLLKRIKSLNITTNKYVGMDGKHTENIPWNLPYAYTFTTQSLEGECIDIWKYLESQKDGAERRLAITYRYSDALSGTTIVKRKTYTPKEIKRGRFGKKFTIK